MDVTAESTDASEDDEPSRTEGCFLILAAAGIHQILGGTHTTLGILVVEWAEYFDTGYRIASWLGTGTLAAAMVFAPVAGVIIKRFGLRRCLIISAIVNAITICCSAFSTNLWVIFILWIITGMAHSFHVGPILAYIMIRFRRHRMIANAFVVSAAASGTIVYGSLINATIEAYTWRGTVVILGALALNAVPCSLILRKWSKTCRPKDTLLTKPKDVRGSVTQSAPMQFAHEEQTGIRDTSGCSNILNLEILRQSAFICVTLSVFFLYLGVSVIYIHIVSGFMDLCKLEIEHARYLVPCLGISNMIARFVVSVICHHPRVDTFTLFLLANILLTATLAIVPLFEGFAAAVTLVVIIGLALGGYGGLTHLIIVDILEEKYILMAVQYMFLPAGIAYMTGGPLAGWVYDNTENFIYSIELTASLVAVSVLILIPFWIKHIRQLLNQKSSNDNIQSASSRVWIASHTSLAL
ncbi:monocarboxylate transporter 14-like [Tubulanus polymorphus]|uniref:monocarboxylate transporter 14-like n=1 Tax=Tubulanus polymorphus TaxID=672921 RepID=UPI003DA50A30